MELYKYSIHYDIRYDEGKRECHFNNEMKSTVDLYIPEKQQTCPKQTPVVLFVHGGGWRRGDKTAWKYFLSRDINFLAAAVYWMYGLYGNIGKALARRGIACAVMSYPLTQLSTKWLLLELTTSYISSLFILGSVLGVFSVLTLPLRTLIGVSFYIRNPLVPVVLTNIISLGIISVQYKYHRLSAFKISVIWIFLFLLSTSVPPNYLLSIVTVVSFVLAQGILLHTNLNVIKLSLEEQVQSVVKCMKKVKDFGYQNDSFNSENLFLMGHSAGGHLCSIVALSESFLMEEGMTKSDIKGVIPISPVLQISRMNTALARPLYLQPTFGDSPDRWIKRCPSQTLLEHSEDSEIPPFFIVTAERDIKLIRDGATHFHNQSNQLNDGISDHVIFPGTNHHSIIKNFDKSIDNVNLADICCSFIKRSIC